MTPIGELVGPVIEQAFREMLRAEIRAAVAEAVARLSHDAPCEWLDARAAAAIAGCHPRTLARRGCPSHGSGRLLRYRRAEVEAWLARRS